MLHETSDDGIVGVEEVLCKNRCADRYIRHDWRTKSVLGLGDVPRRVNYHPPGPQMRFDDIAEGAHRGQRRAGTRRNVQTYRTREVAIDVNSDYPNVRRLVKRIVEEARGTRLDCACAHVSVVTEPIDREFIGYGVGPAILDALEQTKNSVYERNSDLPQIPPNN